MGIFKKLVKNKLFLLGALIPLVFQIVYLCIAIPAIKDGNTGIRNLKIAIVNEDKGLGQSVSAKLIDVLPFETELSSDLTGALKAMDDGDFNMVVHVAGDFSANLQKGAAGVQYYINQSAPSMTKQLMERTAISINQTLNENTFLSVKESIKNGAVTAIGQAGLPAKASTQLSDNLNKAFDSLKSTLISSDIQKTNNADGFIQTVFPFFIFLVYFVGAIMITGLHSVAFKSLKGEYSKSKLLLSKLGVNIAVSLIIPCVVVSLADAFGIPFQLGTGAVWLLLSVGFLTLTYLVQMFSEWFGIAGMGVAALIFFPLQLVTSGLMYSREILPSFYSTIAGYLPATYWGDGLIKIFYGGASISKDVWVLILMTVIFISVSFLTLVKRNKNKGVAIEKSEA